MGEPLRGVVLVDNIFFGNVRPKESYKRLLLLI